MLATLVVTSVIGGTFAFAGMAAAGTAIDNTTITHTPDGAGATSDVNYTGTFNASYSVKEITLDYEQTDVQSVGTSEIPNVTIQGTDYTTSDVSGSGTSTLVITLSQSVSVSSGEDLTITSDGQQFVNPDSAGNYSVTVSATDGSAEVFNESSTLTIGAAGTSSVSNSPVVTTSTNDSNIRNGAVQRFNETTEHALNFSADSADAKVTVMQGNRTIYTTTPTALDSVNGTYDYSTLLEDDGSDYDGLNVGANESATLTYEVINNTAAANPATTTGTYEFQTSEERAFSAASEPVAAQESYWSLGDDEEVGPQKTNHTVNTTANTSTVTVQAANDSVESALGETFDAAHDNGFTTLATVRVDGEMVPLFTENAEIPEWMGNQTYATLDDSGDIDIRNLNTSEGSVDVTVIANERADFWATASTLADYDAGWDTAATLADSDWNGNPEWAEQE